VRGFYRVLEPTGPDVKYTTYVNYGNMPLWQQIMEMRPWVNEENAKRIAEEAYAIPVSSTLHNRAAERSWQIAKHIFAEAKKLKT
jgi:hypothetical protein